MGVDAGVAARRRPRSGFALIAAIALIAVFAVLSLVVTANLSSVNQRNRIEEAADLLYRVETEIIGAPPSFNRHTFANPRFLSHLVDPITNTQQNSCNQNYPDSSVIEWRGPYHLIPRTVTLPFFLSVGFEADNQTVRAPATAPAPTRQNPEPQPGTLFISMQNVDPSDAEALDVKVDGSISGTAGKVRYPTPLGSASVTVQYAIAIAGC